MTPLRLLFFLLTAGVSFGSSQNCHTASTVPADQLKLASGRVITDFDGSASIKGGRAVYSKITNESGVDASYMVGVSMLPEGQRVYTTICMYQARLGPKKSVVVWGSSSAEPPLQWQVSVTMGPGGDVDPGILRYEVYSNPANSSPVKRDSAKR